MMRRPFIILTITLLVTAYSSPVLSQINAYAKVTAISGTSLSISNVNEVYDVFSPGEQVIVMQMQDDVIDVTANASTFGTLDDIASAGLYEVATIASVTGTTLTLTTALTNTYNTGTNSSVQVISFPLLGTPNFTTTADIVALDWNGNVGGVVALRVEGTLTLNHNVTADGAGFRGGAVSGNQGAIACTTAWRSSGSSSGGEKGEGIFRRTDANHRYNRAKILNGGGGGNRLNGGGGGGGNVTAGGAGGPGYQCTTSPIGGQGGIALAPYISTNRVFMGGGGGGGQQDNSVGGGGGDGGGIIFMKVRELVTGGACSERRISANGVTPADVANDGGGGAGAGGTIVLGIDDFDLEAACPLAVHADGGNGANSLSGAIHAGGGGGGQGRVMLTAPVPANATITTNNGTGGCNDNDNPCTSAADPAGGTDGDGISDNVGSTPLPVTLIYFSGVYDAEKNRVALRWATGSEVNNDHFIVERSFDEMNFQVIHTVAGKGTSNSASRYEVFDESLWQSDEAKQGHAYYRLSQVDTDGTMEQFSWIRVDWDEADPDIWVYPNPAASHQLVSIDLSGMPGGAYDIVFFDMHGTATFETTLKIDAGFESVALEPRHIKPGMYTIRISSPRQTYFRKLIVY